MPSRRRVLQRVLAAGPVALVGAAWGADERALRRLEEKFIAPCCWSESVAVHRSETAAELRTTIERLWKEGKSENEITAVLVGQYGERILMEPGGAKKTLLTVMPVAAVVAGAAGLAVYLRRTAKRRSEKAVAAPVAAAEVKDEDLDW